MTLIFGALMGQMVVLSLLLLPLPFKFRRKILDVATLLEQSTNFKVGLVFSTALLGLSFFDCVNRLSRFSSFSNQPYFTTLNLQSGALTHDQLATKFYTQRNLYLNGAVLYLELSIYTIVGVLRKLVKKEAEFRALTSINKGDFASESEEIEKYKDLIKQKEIDISTLKKQILGLQKAFDELTPSTAAAADKKSD